MRFDKASLRRQMAELRKSLAEPEAQRLSEAIQDRVSRAAFFLSARAVGLYRPMGREVETAGLMRDAWASGKTVALPEIADRSLVWRRVEASTRYRKGPEGFEVAVEGDLLDPGELDLILIPGLAFDTRGNRLGRGGGHYDRALAGRRERLVVAGLAYGFQVLPPWTPEPHDQPVDWLVTEAGCRHTAAGEVARGG